MTDQAAQLAATTGSLSLEDASDVHDSIISEAEAFVKVRDRPKVGESITESGLTTLTFL